METIRKAVIFAPYENLQLESYLKDLARQGLLVERMGIIFWEFRKDEPRNRRYRWVLTASGNVSGKETDFYEEMGWHSLEGGLGRPLYYTDDETVEEMFTDPKLYRKRMGWYLFWSAAAILAYFYWLTRIILDLDSTGHPWAPLHLIHETGAITLFGCLLSLIPCVFLFANGIRGYAAQLWRIGRGLLDHPPTPYRGRLLMNRIMISLLIPGLLCLVTGGFAEFWIDTSGTLNFRESHPVSLRTFQPEAWEPFQKYIDGQENSEWIEYSVEQRRSMLFRTEREILSQDFRAGHELDYRVGYYEARSASLAHWYLTEEFSYWDAAASPADSSVPVDGVDEAYYFVDKNKMQHLLLRRGSLLELVHYLGNKALKESIGLFSADLQDSPVHHKNVK